MFGASSRSASVPNFAFILPPLSPSGDRAGIAPPNRPLRAPFHPRPWRSSTLHGRPEPSPFVCTFGVRGQAHRLSVVHQPGDLLVLSPPAVRDPRHRRSRPTDGSHETRPPRTIDPDPGQLPSLLIAWVRARGRCEFARHGHGIVPPTEERCACWRRFAGIGHRADACLRVHKPPPPAVGVGAPHHVDDPQEAARRSPPDGQHRRLPAPLPPDLDQPPVPAVAAGPRQGHQGGGRDLGVVLRLPGGWGRGIGGRHEAIIRSHVRLTNRQGGRGEDFDNDKVSAWMWTSVWD